MTDLDANPLRVKLRPLFDRIIVKEIDNEKVRKSGVVLPDTVSGLDAPPNHGIVIAVGPGLDWWSGQGIEMPVDVGDHIVFPRAAGTWIEVDEEKLLSMRVGEIVAVVEDA
jgi:chaperonin GroES